MPHRLILASSSPRRQELLRVMNFPFEVQASDADETVEPGTPPERIVQLLALRKAETVLSRMSKDERSGVIIGADTIVVIDGDVLGKPADDAEAVRMLGRLQGRVHEVYSGAACLHADQGPTPTGLHIPPAMTNSGQYSVIPHENTGTPKLVIGHSVTKVRFRALSSEQINRYVSTGEGSDKAGSYGIQSLGATLVEGIEGDYFNVVGLPLSLLAEMLGEFGFEIP